MRIGSNNGVGIGKGRAVFFGAKYHRSQIFEIHLMADSRIRWDQPKIIESSLSPAQERVALEVTVELDLRILVESISSTEIIYLHRVINDEIYRRQRVDLFRIAAQTLHRLAHRRQIHDGGHAGQVLH